MSVMSSPSSLPSELVVAAVGSFLDLQSLARLSQVSREFRQLVKDPKVWKHVYIDSVNQVWKKFEQFRDTLAENHPGVFDVHFVAPKGRRLWIHVVMRAEDNAPEQKAASTLVVPDDWIPGFLGLDMEFGQMNQEGRRASFNSLARELRRGLDLPPLPLIEE